MKHHAFGRMPFTVTNVGFGAWQIGGSWGDISEADGRAALNAALDAGMTFIDTADVYGDGRSEKIIADVLKTRGGARPMVATKAGRRLNPHVAEGYTTANLEGFIDRSLKNLVVDSLDLVQLHCPPREVLYQPEVFESLDALQKAGKIKGYGVSVEKVEDGLKAIEYPGVVSIQIIYNIFRQRPDHLFFQEARRKNVAIIARVPLASGLLSGKITRDTHFASDDHRNFNRHGEAFDVGETFAGVPFEVGLQAVEEVRKLVPAGATMAAFALRWILMAEAVTVVIPGARNAEQAKANAAAADLAPLSADVMAATREIYERLIAPHVHQRW
ncbi:aldo/keto reductase [Rhizobium anhuiense]|jgi:aryl-alcohol dehydrogenase-like predicted oxidoreductase|uniref:Aldo/keto reductase n=1 Tax=Rhizobium anhuiense TaxID=1184720 RepID=A0ABX4JAS4_9HYPH|nr:MULTISPECIES: aldo/keto reductase [Rhizobium]KZS54658.1 aldo/keto reductase [Rhizobium anhuiense bv. trifolii]MBB3300843.1 aryl-alcohol dehydrogenase-like predicted oxidoreductase [Rhizobium sp. BK112]MBB3370107.1 aryl-alcohol dehydrogenase-like predicted oxidoreductase [Rhizobium sp. BK077]MBB4180733.1 aryl-alcohol dehydrogenase-like predicted oxidoreductase [Rhizobium sp. BK109]NKM53081.1 aldo/keto reductase [Rhizobium anhuiense]